MGRMFVCLVIISAIARGKNITAGTDRGEGVILPSDTCIPNLLANYYTKLKLCARILLPKILPKFRSIIII